VVIGAYAGKYESGSGTLFIDSIDRTTEALGRTNSLIYGKFDSNPANQTLALGGGGKVGIGTVTPAMRLHVAGTTSNDKIQADVGLNFK